MNTERLVNELIRDEGLRLKPYLDTVGKLTIGIGRNLDDVGISESEARYLLTNDVTKIVHQLMGLPWFNALNEPRQCALANMAFNLGFTGLMSFKNMIEAIQKGYWHDAAKHALNSKWAAQVGKRAERIAEQLRTGVYQ